MPSPEVLSGMRQPRSVRLEDMRKAAATPEIAQVPAPQAGVTVYVSKFRRYLVEVVNVASYTEGGRRYPAKRIAAQFEEGVYRNNHRDPATRKLIDEALQTNPYFGEFGSHAHFWLAAEQNAKMEAGRLKSALDTLKALPKEAVDQFVAELRQGEAEDHEVPPAAPPKGTIRPIAP